MMMKVNRFRVLGVSGSTCIVAGIWMAGNRPTAVALAGVFLLAWGFAEMIATVDGTPVEPEPYDRFDSDFDN